MTTCLSSLAPHRWVRKMWWEFLLHSVISFFFILLILSLIVLYELEMARTAFFKRSNVYIFAVINAIFQLINSLAFFQRMLVFWIKWCYTFHEFWLFKSILLLNSFLFAYFGVVSQQEVICSPWVISHKD